MRECYSREFTHGHRERALTSIYITLIISDSVLRSLVKFLKENSSTITVKQFKNSLHLSWCFASRVVRVVPAINMVLPKFSDLPKEVWKIHIRFHQSFFTIIFTWALVAGFLTIPTRCSFSNCRRFNGNWGGRRSACWRSRTLRIRPWTRDGEVRPMRRVCRRGGRRTGCARTRWLGLLYAGWYEQWWRASGHGIWRVVRDRYRKDSGTHWRHSYKVTLLDWNSRTIDWFQTVKV